MKWEPAFAVPAQNKGGKTWLGKDKEDYADQENWTLSGHYKLLSSSG